ncbi:MAG: hypothetical protein V1821_02330 [bacterium]
MPVTPPPVALLRYLAVRGRFDFGTLTLREINQLAQGSGIRVEKFFSLIEWLVTEAEQHKTVDPDPDP